MKTRKQLIELFTALTAASLIGNAKFKYGSLKNLKIIDSEIETLKTIEKGIAEVLTAYNEKRNELIKKYGTPQEDNMIAITKDSDTYETAVEELTALDLEYKETLDLFATKQNEYVSLLAEEIEFDFKTFEISIDNVPDDFEHIKVFMDFDIVK